MLCTTTTTTTTTAAAEGNLAVDYSDRIPDLEDADLYR
jgi:hypothetical protein